MSKRDREPRAGIFSRPHDGESRSGTTRRQVISIGVFGVVTAVAGLTGIAPAWADKYPSWDDVKRAKNNQAAKAEEVKKIKNLIASLQQRVADTKAAEEEAGQKLYDAGIALTEATARAEQLQQQADEKEVEADAAITKAGQLAAQLYRSGGDNASLGLIFDATASGPDDLLAALGSMTKLVEHNQSVYQSALTAKNTAQSLSDQAVVARDERDRLKQEAEEAYEAAQAAAEAARNALAEQESKQETLKAQLEALQDKTSKTVEQYKKGVEERRKAAEAARKAREAAARRAAEEAAKNNGGGGGGGGGGSTGGGGGGGGSSSGWRWPCSGGYITSPFGWRTHPISGTRKFHEGIDISGSYGEAIWAAKGGTIAYAGWYGGYGNYVLINHGGGQYTGYGHMSSIYRWSGWVNAGTAIGAMGSTGNSTGTHLHFEVRNGRWNPVNPLNYV
ncbi:M23 family metallopeptidase [Paramicrobacterium agarici]|uniref:M23 family metallopeptidase n=1 Tax=Paramicrobacterium agarici TaxID=630514 RepID=UPI00114DFE18|nr:M23 family metallopeptidase [Microbacterium agarici]TQO23475.1 murein DD-endopeptidase MepM/ murein hydrolase activator NlpD [Microbacterium agarici]